MNTQAIRTGAAWVPAWAVGVLIGGMLMWHTGTSLSMWMVVVVAAVIGSATAVVVSCATDRVLAVPHRVAAVVGACVWMSMVAVSGWSLLLVGVLAGAALVAALLERIIPGPANGGAWGVVEGDPEDRRPVEIRGWEALLRRLSSKPLTVTKVEPWERATDGERVYVDLPEGYTVKDLADSTMRERIAGARKLPVGCVVEVGEGTHQGTAVLDVMLRDCLADGGQMISEPATPASITDSFALAGSPKGESLDVCLREESMVVGGTTGSGKTTLLHRIIFFLARCTDTLIWVIDPNGGGVAAPWIGPYARGEADKPTIDWLAENDEEAAVMLAVAKAIAKDRKTSKEATRRKRAANTTVLPVDKDLPAFVIITDEGGEMRQATGLLAHLVDEQIGRLAQIARAEGGRVIMSVLRGTADLLNKGLRTVAGIRICLRMNEEGEADHVLGVNPGRVRLLHKGSAHVYRTNTDYKPVLGRTVNVDIRGIESHAVATAHLRPDLDARGQAIAAKITVKDVLDGRDPRDHIDIARHPVMRDVEAGRAYAGRWDRKQAMLAELRGEDLDDDDDLIAPAVPSVPDRPTVAEPGTLLERFLLDTGVVVEDKPAVPRQATPVEPTPQAAPEADPPAVQAEPAGDVDQASPNTRWLIRQVLAESDEAMTNAQVRAAVVERGSTVSLQRCHQILTSMARKGDVTKDGDYYTLCSEDAGVAQ